MLRLSRLLDLNLNLSLPRYAVFRYRSFATSYSLSSIRLDGRDNGITIPAIKIPTSAREAKTRTPTGTSCQVEGRITGDASEFVPDSTAAR